MKIWTSSYTFEHPWETVVQAATRKYPNPLNSSVAGIDVVDRKVENGVLKSHRLMTTNWGLPHWVTKMVGMEENCFVSEHSEVDPSGRRMVLRSRNVTFSNFVTIDENIEYQVHPEDKNKTLLQQTAVIHVQGVPLTSYMESLVEGTCSNNAQKGRQAMEWVIGNLKEEAGALGKAAQQSMGAMMGSTASTPNPSF